MTKKYLTTLIIIGLMLLMSLYIAGSYAYYQITKEQVDINKVDSGCFNLQFEEISKSIILENTYPMTDKKGLDQKPYTFKITNTCNIAINYTVTLNTLDIANNISDNYLKIAIKKTTAAQQVVKHLSDLTINTDKAKLDISNLKQSYIIESGILNTNESITYDSYIWIDENAGNNIQNKNMKATIAIINKASEERNWNYLAEAIINKFGGKDNIKAAEDAVYKTHSSTTEMYKMEDDYGTSYFLRGDSQSLKIYVSFAGFYWQVIRVNGDDSIRLMLCDPEELLNGFGNYVNYTTQYGSSALKQRTDDWYSYNILNTKNHLYVSDTLFCNDTSIYKKNDTETSFGASDRIHSKKPILKCPNKSDAYTVNETIYGNGMLSYPVAAITADEIFLTDALMVNVHNYGYWTMTPYSKNNVGGNLRFYIYDGILTTDDGTALSDHFVRPVLNLKSDTKVTGSGTRTDPYVVIIN